MTSAKQPSLPRFAFAEHAFVTRADEGGWTALTTEGRTLHLTDEMLGRRGLSIDVAFRQEGFYALMDTLSHHNSYEYRVDYGAGLVHLENGGVPMTIEDFMMGAVRMGDDDRVICSFLDTPDNQLSACIRADAHAHVVEIVDGDVAHGADFVGEWIDAARERRENESRHAFDDRYEAMVA